jgi:hypothetical protein
MHNIQSYFMKIVIPIIGLLIFACSTSHEFSMVEFMDKHKVNNSYLVITEEVYINDCDSGYHNAYLVKNTNDFFYSNNQELKYSNSSKECGTSITAYFINSESHRVISVGDSTEFYWTAHNLKRTKAIDNLLDRAVPCEIKNYDFDEISLGFIDSLNNTSTPYYKWHSARDEKEFLTVVISK